MGGDVLPEGLAVVFLKIDGGLWLDFGLTVSERQAHDQRQQLYLKWQYNISYPNQDQSFMATFKRQSPSLSPNEQHSDQVVQVVSSKAASKKIKTSSQITTEKSPYQAIPEVPHIKLSVAQMNSDPLALVKELEDAYSEYGAVKLTVSEAWNSPYSFGYADRPITVRVQTLQQLKQGKAFEQKVQSLRISEFKEKANSFSRRYKPRTNPQGSSAQALLEQEYWNLVTKSKYEKDKVTVEYGADLPSSLYGSAFPTRKIHNWLDADFDYQSNLYNLNNIHKSPNSLLRVVEAKSDKISGITQPWMYLGMLFATFCWHVEDLFIHSINHNHLGSTKTWYVIPGKHKEDFDRYVKERCESKRKKNLLEKITLMVDPLELIKHGIPVYKINQRERDFVVTFLKAYHCGFSHGFNTCQAVNFVHYNDIDCIKESFRFYEEQEGSQGRKLKSHVISYEWAIYENVMQKLIGGDHPYHDKIMKEYKRILNREYILIKSTIDKYGQFKQVRVIPFHKRYYANMCSHCKNYLYLTSLECKKCKKNLCERHHSMCECQKKEWVLVIRQLNKDRLQLRNLVALIDDKAQKIQK